MLSAENWRKLDAHTIQQQGIESIDLMERAATACCSWIIQQFNADDSLIILCGPGNNGGDGLALARLLFRQNRAVQCVIMQASSHYSEDFKINLERLKATNCPCSYCAHKEDVLALSLENKIVIDCLFGYGLSRSIKGVYSDLIQCINTSFTHKVIAIDIPSGMNCSMPNKQNDCVTEADYTLTFHAPKISFFYSEKGSCTGHIEILDIGLDDTFYTKLTNNNFYFTAEQAAKFLPKRKIYSHKGTYGHAFLIAGSKGKMGASVLMVSGASRTGVGLVTVAVPDEGRNVMQISVPTAMCFNQVGEWEWSKEIHPRNTYTYGIGPGLGTADSTAKVFTSFLKEVNQPIVLDADGINLLAMYPEMIADLPKNSILTPHVGEFKRLVGDFSSDEERLLLQRKWAVNHGVYVVLKDARTIIATPKGDCYFTMSGTTGMATGGSGDVLTGIIIGFLAQGISPRNAALLGVILHGMAGQLAAKKQTDEAMIASDIVNEMGAAYKFLKNEIRP